ncbi:UDP-N-acetylglucosamine 2-epimerase (hydrolysing) [Caminicella sporogenes DSM 14501]|uniref:UDP-N-acetylglucosamine 2-epimerase (Hydrolysing) n=1 Tax=Caminicella sporogenes DSM 14501 TaxID=1121266 RepID=A0A1M6Q2N1_9FIRM|nr:UDP-N-acetylglucosamine 2-epimerase [Caminicella sporogenes]RKD23554.1 UDP-N-acetyl-D-glucosamine 2-epimerase, UDP-hydrolysing [Caminicella sporogenes]SHK14479.1 UDP-N-acetylglucosamine 2-epimerase (hydrolysing) [Caminicella sporogenes DSM 14501]
MKKIVFLTGTRADYGKIKSLMKKIEEHKKFELYIFVTGMHLLSKYGSTYKEIEKDGFKNIYKYINQKANAHMDIILSNTILGFSNYVSEIKPDMIVVHGDRLEALAGAIVGAFNNIKVAHIEGGEVSGTIDESIRHAITKFSHIHFVANEEAKKRVIQLGEREDSIYIIGSPDIDIMASDNLPTLEYVKEHYEIDFENYAIFIYHPVTTEVHKLKENIKNVVDALIKSNKNYVVIYPNNDEGSEIILNEYKRFKYNSHFKIFPSIRFENFLTLLKNCDFMIGNSSAGVRETGVYGIPSIDIGNRQQGRYDLNKSKHIVHVNNDSVEILNAIKNINKMNVTTQLLFGDGKSDEKFIKILESSKVWEKQYQKKFIDILDTTELINSETA